MMNALRPILEISVIIPGILLAYLPAHTYLKQRRLRVLSWMLPLLLVLSVCGGLLCYGLNIGTAPIMLAAGFVAGFAYVRSLDLSLWKSGSVALAICAVFACVNSLSRAINAIMTADLNITENELWFCFGAALIYNLFCWLFVLLAWYPATHAARALVEDDNLAQTWYVFWILPMVFIGLNLFMVPKYRETLYQGRVMQGYIVLSIVLLAILALFYAMFLMMANSLNRNAKLQQENHFLSMQRARYDNLCTAIEETRHARHDLRHHFTQLSAMAKDGELDQIKNYLSKAQEKIPNLDMRFSENRAADSVIGHYCALARRENVPFLTNIDLPAELPVDEMDMCLILSNLLENALEASGRTNEIKRQIKVEIYLHSGRLLLIQIENTYDGNIKEKDGIFQSSKRKGNGIGIQSVRRIAEKNGGDSTFSYNDGIFTAKIMLRG